jgi:hypothetical protein
VTANQQLQSASGIDNNNKTTKEKQLKTNKLKTKIATKITM